MNEEELRNNLAENEFFQRRVLASDTAWMMLPTNEKLLYEDYMDHYAMTQKQLVEKFGDISLIPPADEDNAMDGLKLSFPGIIGVLTKLANLEDQILANSDNWQMG